MLHVIVMRMGSVAVMVVHWRLIFTDPRNVRRRSGEGAMVVMVTVVMVVVVVRVVLGRARSSFPKRNSQVLRPGE